MESRKLDSAHALEFILAGKAVVTLRSAETGTRYTYKVSKADEQPGAAGVFASPARYFVSLLTGPENTSDYTYLGMIVNGNEFKLTKASKMPEGAAPVKAFRFALQRPDSPKLEIFHEGRCGRCGRKLTVPESIESGFGPECIGKM